MVSHPARERQRQDCKCQVILGYTVSCYGLNQKCLPLEESRTDGWAQVVTRGESLKAIRVLCSCSWSKKM